MKREKVSNPVLIHGAIHCGFCKCPLILVKRGESDYCALCGSKAGKLTDEQLIQLAEGLPDQWLKDNLL